jgi:hypothetical protein
VAVPDAMLNLASDDEAALKRLVKLMKLEIARTGAIAMSHRPISAIRDVLGV